MRTQNLICGRMPVNEALSSSQPIDKILLQQNANGEGIGDIIRLAKQHFIPVQRVPIHKLNQLTKTNHQGVIALGAQVQYHRLQDIIDKTYNEGVVPFFVWLDGITDVRNIGAIARTAYCYGAQAILLTEKGNGAINEDAMKTSAGALMKISVVRERNNQIISRTLKQNGIEIYASSLDTDSSLYDMKFNHPLCIVMGAEDIGISQHVVAECADTFIIPMSDQFDSLNVSVAAGIICNEVFRQRSNRDH